MDLDEAIATFQELDVDGDGYITRGEFLRGCAGGGRSEEELVAGFEAVDTDGDGLLAIDDFFVATYDGPRFVATSEGPRG